MKSEYHWLLTFRKDNHICSLEETFESRDKIKRIQNDAYKQGITDCIEYTILILLVAAIVLGPPIYSWIIK